MGEDGQKRQTSSDKYISPEGMLYSMVITANNNILYI